jgi:hypothetical protein
MYRKDQVGGRQPTASGIRRHRNHNNRIHRNLNQHNNNRLGVNIHTKSQPACQDS